MIYPQSLSSASSAEAPAESPQQLNLLETASIHPAGATPAKRFYAPELDCLRFLAFLGVFLFHTIRALPLDGFPPGLARIVRAVGGAGAFGVDLFFVLSAYLITQLLLREKAQTGRLDVRAFYVRRILRIWPLYFFFLGVAALLPLVAPTQQFGWKYLVGFSLLSGNWTIVLFGVPASVANILWSVSIEEQFYLLWPPLVRRLSIKNITAVAAAVLVVSNLTRFLLYSIVQASNQSVWFNTFVRVDPIVLGILLAVFLGTRRIVASGLWRLFLTSASVMALVVVSAYGNLHSHEEPISALGVAAYPVVALSCLGILLGTLGIGTELARGVLVYMGKISYGLYVYHLLGLWLAKTIFSGLHGVPYFAVCACTAFAVTLCLSALSYHFLESPFLQLKKRFTYVPSRPV
jgi:peptidoglycan/LPS O-acetylase OafA/YrhL